MFGWLKNIRKSKTIPKSIEDSRDLFASCVPSALQELLDLMVRYLGVGKVSIFNGRFYRVVITLDKEICIGTPNRMGRGTFLSYHDALKFATSYIWESLGDAQQRYLLSLFSAHFFTYPMNYGTCKAILQVLDEIIDFRAADPISSNSLWNITIRHGSKAGSTDWYDVRARNKLAVYQLAVQQGLALLTPCQMETLFKTLIKKNREDFMPYGEYME